MIPCYTNKKWVKDLCLAKYIWVIHLSTICQLKKNYTKVVWCQSQWLMIGLQFCFWFSIGSFLKLCDRSVYIKFKFPLLSGCGNLHLSLIRTAYTIVCLVPISLQFPLSYMHLAISPTYSYQFQEQWYAVLLNAGSFAILRWTPNDLTWLEQPQS